MLKKIKFHPVENLFLFLSWILCFLSILFLFLFLPLEWKGILSIVFLFLSMGSIISTFFLKGKPSFLVSLLCPIFLSVSLGFVYYLTVYDFVDFFQGITMFGNSGLVPFDLTILLLLLFAQVCSFVSLFLNCHHEK